MHITFDTMCFAFQLLHSSLFSLHPTSIQERYNKNSKFKPVPLAMQYEHLSKQLISIYFVIPSLTQVINQFPLGEQPGREIQAGTEGKPG